MNGPEHYLKAEELIEQYRHASHKLRDPSDYLVQAQIHATLALTAATVGPTPSRVGGQASEPRTDWAGVL